MKTLGKLTLVIAGLGLIAAIPARAQIANGVSFKASAAFYAGNAKFPAGSYTITQSTNDNILLIRSAASKFEAFLDIVPTNAAKPHTKSEVTFHNYGGVDYLNQIWVEGQRYGLQVDPTKAEQKAAAGGSSAPDHSVPAVKQ
jgi:hypothetical protein